MSIDDVLAKTAKSAIDPASIDAEQCRAVIAAAARLREPKIGVKSAAALARRIVGCYRAKDFVDPEMFTSALVWTLSDHPAILVELISDPRGGIVRKRKFAPAIAEVAEDLEALRRSLEAAAWGARRALDVLAYPRTPRPAIVDNNERAEAARRLTEVSLRMTGERE